MSHNNMNTYKELKEMSKQAQKAKDKADDAWHLSLIDKQHTSDREYFRIEEKKVYDEIQYDLIWQANGKNEEIAILLENEQLQELRDLIDSKI